MPPRAFTWDSHRALALQCGRPGLRPLQPTSQASNFLSFRTMPLYLCICLGCSSPDFFTHQTPMELSRPRLEAASFVELHGSSGQWVILSSDMAVFPPFINNTRLPHCPVIIWTPGPDQISPSDHELHWTTIITWLSCFVLFWSLWGEGNRIYLCKSLSRKAVD